MDERRREDRRKEDRRKDIESARNFIGMQKRLAERRLGERRHAWSGYASVGSIMAQATV
jgi:hypothetical protein